MDRDEFQRMLKPHGRARRGMLSIMQILRNRLVAATYGEVETGDREGTKNAR